MKSKSGKISTFAPMQQEANTPTISNRTSPVKPPPPLSLGRRATSSDNNRRASERSLSSSSITPTRSLQQARFSSSTVTPIVVHRSSRSISQNRTLFPPGQTFSPSLTVPTALQQLHQQQKRRRSTTSPISTIGEFSLWSTKNNNHYGWMVRLVFLVACDLLKSGVPIQMLRRFVERIIIQLSLPFRPVTKHLKLSTAGLGICFHSTTGQAAVTTGLQIRGIPNYGQTCFLNSVLQALASLPPFFVYLERIIQVEEELSVSDNDDEKSYQKGLFRRHKTSQSLFSRQLLDILHAINGSNHHHNNNNNNNNNNKRIAIDPRGLLQRIGKHNPQFQTRHTMEQQDAQELLQTLVDIVITDARLDCTSSSDDQHLRFFLDEGNNYESDTDNEETYNEILTAVIAAGGNGDTTSNQNLIDLSKNSDDKAKNNSFVSLPDLVHRIEKQQRDLAESQQMEKNVTITNSQSLQREEKKQEDFEIRSNLSNLTVGDEGTHEKIAFPATLIQADKTEREKLQKSLQILQSTMSSITPSPLSGWIGSALRCCHCNHVRAIQNAPFLNIPVVPTSIPNYLAKAHRPGERPSPPNLSALPLCSLDQCLADFTSVERVQDVECRSCTIQKQLKQLEEEAMLLRGAIGSTEKRILQKGGDPSEQTKCLREDLSRVELRIVKLQMLDPDDDQNLAVINQDVDTDTIEGTSFRKNKSLERCDALKCLTLTRCPSVLCCHIQRRYLDPFTDRMEKCIQFVEFPEVFDLGPYCAYNPMTGTSWAAGSLKKEDQQQQTSSGRRNKFPYRLQGIIEHRGNAHGGHYICYRRDHSGEWFRISDSNITPIPWRQVRTCQAYMLFYEAV